MSKHEKFTSARAKPIQRKGTLTSTGGSTATFIASTDSVDSYGDIVEQDGIDLSHFKSNPVILFGHDPRQVIGKAERVRLNASGDLVADIRFADKVAGAMGEMAHAVAEMIKAGFINAVSIGFTSKDREPIYNADGELTGIRFLTSILKEISVVSVPANPDALAVARAAGLGAAVTSRLLRPALKPSEYCNLSPAQRITARQIKVHKMVGEAQAAQHSAYMRSLTTPELAALITRRRKAQVGESQRRIANAEHRAEAIRHHQEVSRGFR